MILLQFIDLLKQNDLLVSWQALNIEQEINGKPVTDSRLLNLGDVFFCIKGLQSDGHKYIAQARDKGVQFIVQENEYVDSLPCIRVTNSRKAAALFSKLYYNNPTGNICLIGITGTNGKTTTSLLIWQALTKLGHKTGWIGTLGYIITGDIISTNNTTPDIIELNSIFTDMVNYGCKFVVMEVSSHALALDRVYGLEFDLALFTNLTHDHLDFHPDMDDYFRNKVKLFNYATSNSGHCIINTDDEYGKKIPSQIIQGKDRITSISSTKGDVTIVNTECSLSGSDIEINYFEQKYNLHSRLIGYFNVVNFIMAYTSIRILLPEINEELLESTFSELDSVKGRLEQVHNKDKIGVFVDYAHTPDALRNVLSTLNAVHHKRIITVFGAGGDRDKSKRPKMLKETLNLSDVVIITDDNPRTEDPNQIIMDIISECELFDKWWIIRNREHAIASALRMATAEDIVLIAGKGHENYQEINGKKNHFDDVLVANKYLNHQYPLNPGALALPVDRLMLNILYGGKCNKEKLSVLTAPTDYYYISTDTRSINSGSVYFALKGEHFDGNNFVESVLHDTNNAAITSIEGNQDRAYYADSTQTALGLLAKKYLQLFSPIKVALTGSTGKTTTKEYVASILSVQGKVLKTLQNENNIIGLCKTIFRIEPRDRYAVFELGTNNFGEIAQLADICNPDIAIITNIGPSHLEFFKDEDGVYTEKTSLFRRPLHKVIYPADDPRFYEFKYHGVSVGVSEESNYRLSEVSSDSENTKFKLSGINFNVHQPVPFYAINISYAIACASELGFTQSEIQQALNIPVKLNMRMEIKRHGNYLLIEDCYNANPVSMKSALEYWQSVHPEIHHFAILGDMLELGNLSSEYHLKVGEILKSMSYFGLITVGHYSKLYHTVSNDVSAIEQHYPEINRDNIREILQMIPNRAVIIVKASHGIHLEKVSKAIEEKYLVLLPNQLTEE